MDRQTQMNGMGSWAIIISAVLLPVGVVSLAMQRRWASLLVVVVAVGGYPYVMFRAMSAGGDPDLRIWLALPLICLVPIWTLSGFFVFNWAHDSPQTRSWKKGPPDTPEIRARRWKGVALCMFGIFMWVLVALHPDWLRNGSDEAMLIAVTLYPLCTGLYWAALGKGLFEPSAPKRRKPQDL